MGASNPKPSNPMQSKDGVADDGLTHTCGHMEVSNSRPLDDVYISIRTADIRSDYLYSGLTQHYQAGNAVTVSFNLVPKDPTDPSLSNHASNHRAIIRLAPSNRDRAEGGIEYDFQETTSMMMSFALLFGKKSKKKSNESITIPIKTGSEGAPSSIEDALSGAEGITSGIEDAASGAEGITSGIEDAASGAEGITSGIEDAASGSEGTTSSMKGTGFDTQGRTSDTIGGASSIEGVTDYASNTATQNNVGPFEKIAQCSSQGGRVMCITVMGNPYLGVTDRADPFNPKIRFSSDYYVDVFLEIPRTPSPAKFVYQAVTTLIPYRVKGLWNKKVSVMFDYMDFFMKHLNQGWKLVGIIQYYAGRNTLRSVWLFEKETARLHDPTPVYKGNITTHGHIFERSTNGEEEIKSDVRPILKEMGAKGWEMACSLETPDAKQLNNVSIQIDMLLFFQRPIISAI